jgi:cytidyltransferase-like protein|tara:strand:- start:259 stop:807 length:549 start_codon:yes stop_codon:yes gene_type:complete
MKKAVWLNKSNGQLCVTIPKDSGIKAGDIVNVEKEKIKTIVYTPVTADLFHYGHLKILEAANNLGDFHICGVVTDKGIRTYKKGAITNLKERMAIVSALRCVDMVVTQDGKSAMGNLKKIHSQFKGAKLILVHGSNWKKIPAAEYVKKINGEVVRLPFYEKLSTKKMIGKILNLYKDGVDGG